MQRLVAGVLALRLHLGEQGAVVGQHEELPHQHEHDQHQPQHDLDPRRPAVAAEQLHGDDGLRGQQREVGQGQPHARRAPRRRARAGRA